MKVAITGATGTIGRQVLVQLLKSDTEVVALVRPSGRHSLLARGAHRVVEVDVHSPPPNLFELMGKPDVLIHLAWSGLPNYRSLHHFASELQAQYRFLESLVSSGLSSLLVAGTCFEYGMQSGALAEETPTRPDNPYGFAKDALRRQLEFLKASVGFRLTWARLFYLHGEGQSPTSLYPQLRSAVERGDKTFDMSGGEQLRDYLPLADAAGYLVSLALSSSDIGCINVCSGKPISVRRLVEGWISEHSLPITLNLGHYPYPDYEPMAFWGDRTKLDSLMGTP